MASRVSTAEQTSFSSPSSDSTEISLPPTGSLAHSLKTWRQIENQDEVALVLNQLQSTSRKEVYKSAALYDLAYPGYQGDKQYYVDKARSGRVLYLGVGTGRIFAQVAETNPNAIGIDISPEMLQLLLDKCPKIHASQALHADALSQDILKENSFETIVAPYSFLQCFSDSENAQLLNNVRHWLRPGGKFHTDTFSPYLIPFTKKGIETDGQSNGEQIRIAIYALYDHIRQKMKEFALIQQSGQEDQVLEMDLYYYFPHEIIRLMQDAGLCVSKVAGGYNNEKFDTTENEIIVYEATKQPSSNGNGHGRLSTY